MRMSCVGVSCCKQNHLVALLREIRLAGGLAQHTLAPVSEHSVSQPFSTNEGDSRGAAFVTSEHCHAHEPAIGPLATRKDPFEVPLGLDGLHTELDGQPLAALGATTGQNGATTLGGHARAEAVGLGTLALVRLIRTLHGDILLGVTT